MNETTKKIVLGSIIVIAVALVVYQGINLVKGPALEPTMSFGKVAPGHGAKAMEVARQKKERATKPGSTGSPNEMPKEAQLGG